MDELEQAHFDYEMRKSHIIADLSLLHQYVNNDAVKFILKTAIDFIKEKEL